MKQGNYSNYNRCVKLAFHKTFGRFIGGTYGRIIGRAMVDIFGVHSTGVYTINSGCVFSFHIKIKQVPEMVFLSLLFKT